MSQTAFDKLKPGQPCSVCVETGAKYPGQVHIENKKITGIRIICDQHYQHNRQPTPDERKTLDELK